MQKKKNDPKSTWKLASYVPVERRSSEDERRKDAARASQGERRKSDERKLHTLLRF